MGFWYSHWGSLEHRRDAALGASAFTLATRQTVLEHFPGGFANVGRIQIEPGNFNIVPAKAELAFEFRSADIEQFKEMGKALLAGARTAADRFGLELDVEFIGQRLPVDLDKSVQAAIQSAAGELGLTRLELISRAGHDAQPIADLCPAGMIFVPSVGGASHSPEEFTPWEECVNGANVLLQAALRLANKSQ